MNLGFDLDKPLGYDECVSDEDIMYMKRALLLAKEAGELGEVPIGAVAVWKNDEKRGIVSEAIGFGKNERENGKNALYHAEIIAIDQACKCLSGWRLHKCTLYVTLEPCAMCAGAIINARIERVVFGAFDKRFGAFGGRFDIRKNGLNHTPCVTPLVLANEASQMLSDFFANLRKN